MLCAVTCLLPACSGGQEELPPVCAYALDQEACERHGGMFSEWTLGGETACYCPTSDAGRPCTHSAECEGACLVDYDSCQTATAGACGAWEPFIGCACVFEYRFEVLDGTSTPTTAQMLCVD